MAFHSMAELNEGLLTTTTLGPQHNETCYSLRIWVVTHNNEGNVGKPTVLTSVLGAHPPSRMKHRDVSGSLENPGLLN